MASYDLKAILGEKLRRLTDKTLKALVDCMCTVGASLCSLDKRVSALESVELPEGGYKPMQEPVASPSASGTAVQFIDSILQDATGRMTATKKTVRTGSGSQTGVLKLSDSTSSASGVNGGIAATPAAVKAAYDFASGKVNKVPSATLGNFAIFNADGSLMDSFKNTSSFMTYHYVEGVHMPNSGLHTFVDVGRYDYSHDDVVDEPQGGELDGDLSSIVFWSNKSWNPGTHSVRDYIIYSTGFTSNKTEDFSLEGLINGHIGGQKPARRFRLYFANQFDNKMTVSFIRQRTSATSVTDIDIISNMSPITTELKVVIAPNRTVIVDVCIPKFHGLNFENVRPIVFINVLGQTNNIYEDTTSTVYNFNDFTETGIYALVVDTDSTNKPGTINGRYTLQVFNSNGYIVQTMYGERMYYRIRTSSGSWGAWYRMTRESVT